MASPKITKQGASFPEDEPGTPKLLPGDGGDRSARIHRAEAEATERPGEEGDRFADLNLPEQEQSPARQPEVEEEGGVPERETYEGDAWSKEALQTEATKRGLATSGNKPELAARLREHDRAQTTED